MNRIICNECETVKHCMQHGCIPKIPLRVSQDKPTVLYFGIPQFSDWGEHRVAHLQHVIGHPALGNCSNVRTSSVQSVEDDGTIVTRNTIYKRLTLEIKDETKE